TTRTTCASTGRICRKSASGSGVRPRERIWTSAHPPMAERDRYDAAAAAAAAAAAVAPGRDDPPEPDRRSDDGEATRVKILVLNAGSSTLKFRLLALSGGGGAPD